MGELLLLGISLFAGFLGALLGLGGGIIIVPVLTLVFHVNIRYAIAASLISVVATSSGAAASYLKESLTNLRLAVFLEMGTVSGALVGFFISTSLKSSFLFLLFGLLLLFSAFMMLRKREDHHAKKNHSWSEKLQLMGICPDGTGGWIHYNIEGVPLGLIVMFGAGVLSAVLGIGSGIFKVLAMDGIMKLPMKVSSATSNFMMGVTAAGSAGACLLRGDIRPEIAGPVALGIIVGSFLGAKIMLRMPALRIRKLFIVVLFIVSFQMMAQGLK